MLPSSLQLAMFDMAGTTVNDKVGGYPLMIISMIRAFADHGIALAPDLINTHRLMCRGLGSPLNWQQETTEKSCYGSNVGFHSVALAMPKGLGYTELGANIW